MTGTSAKEDWLSRIDAVQEARGHQADQVLALWAGAVLVLMLLYICIGPNPYQHDITLDPLTGGAETSPINRLIWLGLLGPSARSCGSGARTCRGWRCGCCPC